MSFRFFGLFFVFFMCLFLKLFFWRLTLNSLHVSCLSQLLLNIYVYKVKLKNEIIIIQIILNKAIFLSWQNYSFDEDYFLLKIACEKFDKYEEH